MCDHLGFDLELAGASLEVPVSMFYEENAIHAASRVGALGVKKRPGRWLPVAYLTEID